MTKIEGQSQEKKVKRSSGSAFKLTIVSLFIALACIYYKFSAVTEVHDIKLGARNDQDSMASQNRDYDQLKDNNDGIMMIEFIVQF